MSGGSAAKKGQTKCQKNLFVAKTHHGINKNNTKNKNEHLFNTSFKAFFFTSLENNDAFTHSTPLTEYLPVTRRGGRLCLQVWGASGPLCTPRSAVQDSPEGSRDSWGSSRQGDCARCDLQTWGCSLSPTPGCATP